MKKKSDALLMDVVRALITLNLIAVIGFILTASNLLAKISKLGTYLIIWPIALDLEFGSWLLVLFVYYGILFLIPVLGLIKHGKKYLKVNLTLIILNLINLILFSVFLNHFAFRSIV